MAIPTLKVCRSPPFDYYFFCIGTFFEFFLLSAAHVALDAVRQWLEGDGNNDKVDAIVFCVFTSIDEQIYESLMVQYFPVANSTPMRLTGPSLLLFFISSLSFFQIHCLFVRFTDLFGSRKHPNNAPKETQAALAKVTPPELVPLTGTLDPSEIPNWKDGLDEFLKELESNDK